MNAPLTSSGLDHIDNFELARLINLWRAQASSGQEEANEIARAFILEQQRRLRNDKANDFNGINGDKSPKSRPSKYFFYLLIKKLIKTENKLL